MVRECNVLGHKVSSTSIEVDPAKMEVPPPNCVKVVRSFLGHAGFYRRFVRNFSKIVKPMNVLLAKEAIFNFSNECIQFVEGALD